MQGELKNSPVRVLKLWLRAVECTAQSHFATVMPSTSAALRGRVQLQPISRLVTCGARAAAIRCRTRTIVRIHHALALVRSSPRPSALCG